MIRSPSALCRSGARLAATYYKRLTALRFGLAPAEARSTAREFGQCLKTHSMNTLHVKELFLS